jgi:DNA helicase-2/ATP-dependent DNA helicase PcrA
MGMSFLGYYTEDLVNNDDKYLFAVSLRKNNSEVFQKHIFDLEMPKYNFVEHNYQRFKHEVGILDFDDMLLHFIAKEDSLPVKVAIIDEAQDLTSLQWEFCRVAFQNCEQVYVAGDDDQAIYEWSGADVKHFLDLTKHYPVKVLDKSYRLKPEILAYSKKIVNKIKQRVDKEFESDTGKGTIQFYNSVRDIKINNEQTYFFLSRNNYFLPKIKNLVMKKGVPFSYKGEPFIKPHIYKAIKRYEHLRKHEPHKINEETALKILLRKDLRGWPVWYDAFELPLDEITYYRDLYKNKADVNDNKVSIGTIHSFKGGEADNVVLLLDITRNVYNEISNNRDSELRCLYVALTRAKKNLHIVYSNSKFGYEELLSD